MLKMTNKLIGVTNDLDSSQKVYVTILPVYIQHTSNSLDHRKSKRDQSTDVHI